MRIILFVTSLVYCECTDDSEANVCASQAEEDYYVCMSGCGILVEPSCATDCNRQYSEQIYECPCNEGCPNGCPCPIYPCPTTTPMLTTTQAPSNVSVLILNTYNSSHIPVLANLNGNINLNLSFEIENNVDVYHSCGVQFQGNFYVYGSSVYTGRNTQIAMISDCALKRIATLPFTHE